MNDTVVPATEWFWRLRADCACFLGRPVSPSRGGSQFPSADSSGASPPTKGRSGIGPERRGSCSGGKGRTVKRETSSPGSDAGQTGSRRPEVGSAMAGAEAEGCSLLGPPMPPQGMAEVEVADEAAMKQFRGGGGGGSSAVVGMDVERSRFPYCVVWTPIPLLTWVFPIIGHMGICTSTGVIRDFAGPYYVSEDNMAFGKPVKYWKLDPSKVQAGRPNAWDTAVHEASEEYKHRMHNLCCDNCHSHVALALNLMRYNNSSHWNMVKVGLFCLIYGKYVSVGAFVKTWLPFVLLLGIIVTTALVFNLR